MSIIDLIKTSLYSIKAHKLRVFLTMIGIIIGISSTVTVKSIGDGLSNYVVNSMEQTKSNDYLVYFQSNFSYLTEDFTEDDINEIQKIEGVTKVDPYRYSGYDEYKSGNVTFFSKSYQTQITSNEEEKRSYEIEYGRWLNDGEKNAIVLSYDVANKLFDSNKEALGKGVSFDGDIYEVIGVTKKLSGIMAGYGGYCFISQENLKSVIKGDDPISMISITIDPKKDKDLILDKTKSLLADRHPSSDGEYMVEDIAASIESMTTMIGALTTFVSAITGIALFVGGVGVMNIMYVSVTERKREIGIRRAIGAKPRTILFQFLFEAVIVTGVGGIIGIVLGYILGSLVSTFIPIEGFKAVLTAKTLIGSASISVLVGVIFGIIPARNASKMDPIKAIYQ